MDADTATTLVVQKTPVVYPDAARKSGVQGKVVLRVVTNYSGDVEEVTVISGDPALAQPAAAAVKQWKYKPYLVDGTPAEMETQVSLNFQLKTPSPPGTPPLGIFRDGGYSNDYFGFSYPLSREWLRETDMIRSKTAAEENPHGTYVLLAAIHLPQDSDPSRADTSLIIKAAYRPSAPPQDCADYLQAVAASLRSQKEGESRGDVTQFTVAGHDFYRGNFEYSHGVNHGAVLCTSIKDYMLRWHIVGRSKEEVEVAVSTLQAITPTPPMTTPQPPTAVADGAHVPDQVRISSGVSTGLLVRKVTPEYPPNAKYAHIQGTVVLQAVINKTGDVVDLEIVSGPMELVLSAVNAVRKWKYRPYLLKGNPIAVQTQIVVNYTLQR
ncbi:MAG: energy transducer TonB [Acidobacteriia bacterium]|nr:energy transducer TonB [Terriglobia bacterium]